MINFIPFNKKKYLNLNKLKIKINFKSYSIQNIKLIKIIFQSSNSNIPNYLFYIVLT
jgi:hypothetical protein